MARIGAILIGVTDMEKAAAFYRDALDLQVEQRIHPGLVQLKHEGPHLLLQQAEARANADYPRDAQTLAVFYVDDIDAAVARLRRAGAALAHASPQEAPVGLYVGFRDPWGNAHELLEPRPDQG